MSPEEAVARRLRAEIEHELERLARLRRDAAGAPQTDDPYAIRARGSILHDLYNGIERICGRIAIQHGVGFFRRPAPEFSRTALLWGCQPHIRCVLPISGERRNAEAAESTSVEASDSWRAVSITASICSHKD